MKYCPELLFRVALFETDIAFAISIFFLRILGVLCSPGHIVVEQ